MVTGAGMSQMLGFRKSAVKSAACAVQEKIKAARDWPGYANHAAAGKALLISVGVRLGQCFPNCSTALCQVAASARELHLTKSPSGCWRGEGRNSCAFPLRPQELMGNKHFCVCISLGDCSCHQGWTSARTGRNSSHTGASMFYQGWPLQCAALTWVMDVSTGWMQLGTS